MCKLACRAARCAALLAGVACGVLAPAPRLAAEGAPQPPAAAAGARPLVPIEELWARGERAFEAGDLPGALEAFGAALAADERRARSWNYLGGVHFAQGDLARAMVEFRKALTLDPRDVRAVNNLGTALERLGDYPAAEAQYRLAAQIDPAYPLSHRNLGILCARRLGDPAGARRAWERYLELSPAGPYAEEVRAALAELGEAPPAPPPSPAPR